GLAADCGFAEYLGGLLERGGRQPSFSLQRRLGNTLQRRPGYGSQRVAYFHELLVFPAKHRVFIAQLPCRYNLSRFQVLRISGIDHHLLVEDVVVFFTEDKLVDILAGQEVGISRIDDLDFLHHLAYDRLDVLVVDLHTLQTVYFLDFVHQVFLYGRRALDRQDIGRGDRPIRKLLTSLHEVVILNQDVL